MTTKQLAILNSLVTFAAENIPGGMSEEEREVAQIVGGWATEGAPLNTVTHDDPTIERFKCFLPPHPPPYYGD